MAVTPTKILATQWRAYLAYSLIMTTLLVDLFLPNDVEHNTFARRVAGTALYLATPYYVWLALGSATAIEFKETWYNLVALVAWAWMFVQAVQLLYKKNEFLPLTSGMSRADAWEAFYIISYGRICHDGTGSPSARFLSLTSKYKGDLRLYELVPVFDCLYGFPEWLTLATCWTGCVSYLVLSFALFVPFKGFRVFGGVMLLMSVLVGYLVDSNGQAQAEYRPSEEALRFFLAVVVLYETCRAASTEVWTNVWLKRVLMPSLATSSEVAFYDARYADAIVRRDRARSCCPILCTLSLDA